MTSQRFNDKAVIRHAGASVAIRLFLNAKRHLTFNPLAVDRAPARLSTSIQFVLARLASDIGVTGTHCPVCREERWMTVGDPVVAAKLIISFLIEYHPEH